MKQSTLFRVPRALISVLIISVIALASLVLSVQPVQAAEITPADLNVGSSTQVMIVTSTSWTTSYASLQTWENIGGTWTKMNGAMKARIGYNGFKKDADRKQNSGTTPAGNYTIKNTFGVSGNPGTKMPYMNFDSNDYWPYDPRDARTYNVMQTSRSSKAYWRTSEAEKLSSYSSQYKYAGIIGYNLPSGISWNSTYGEYHASNTANTTKGGGIFLHVNGSGATAGCVSLVESSMLKVLNWMDPAKEPRIIMGPTSYVPSL